MLVLPRTVKEPILSPERKSPWRLRFPRMQATLSSPRRRGERGVAVGKAAAFSPGAAAASAPGGVSVLRVVARPHLGQVRYSGVDGSGAVGVLHFADAGLVVFHGDEIRGEGLGESVEGEFSPGLERDGGERLVPVRATTELFIERRHGLLLS